MSWCDKSFIPLNAAKTKDMGIDLRKSSSPATMTVIKGEEIELVGRDRYLATALKLKKRNCVLKSIESLRK